MAKTKITLAMETAISGGSLTLFDGDSVLDDWVGQSEVSRSEELLEAISALLLRNNKKPRELTELFVSRGPGSLTGVRIGLATAIGLRNGLNIKCFGVSILEAFNHKWGNSQLNVVTAVCFGKNEVCLQYFQPFGQGFDIKYKQNFNQIIEKMKMKSVTGNNSLKTTSVENFVRFLQLAAKQADEENSKIRIITNRKLYNAIELCSQNIYEFTEVLNAGQNLSAYIGCLGLNNEKNKGSDNLRPVYVN